MGPEATKHFFHFGRIPFLSEMKYSLAAALTNIYAYPKMFVQNKERKKLFHFAQQQIIHSQNNVEWNSANDSSPWEWRRRESKTEQLVACRGAEDVAANTFQTHAISESLSIPHSLHHFNHRYENAFAHSRLRTDTQYTISFNLFRTEFTTFRFLCGISVIVAAYTLLIRCYFFSFSCSN